MFSTSRVVLPKFSTSRVVLPKFLNRRRRRRRRRRRVDVFFAFFGSLSWIGNFYGSLVLKQFFYRFFSAREEIFQPSQSSSFLVPKDQSNLVIFLFFSNTSPIHSSFLPPFHHLFSFLQAFAVICLALFQVRSPFLVHHITYSVFHLFCVRKLFVFH